VGARLFVCLVLAASTATAAAPVAAAARAEPNAGLVPADVDPDTVHLLVRVRADGSAHWRVEYRTRLEDDNRTAAFESLQSDVRSDPESYVAEFRELMAPSVKTASEETGREMAIENVSVATEREFAPPTGVVIYEFEWTRFAATDGEELVVGDALNGFFVSEETILRFEWSESHALKEARPDPDERSEGSVEWYGRTAFGSEEPRLRLAPASGSGDEGGDGSGDGIPLDAPLSLAAVAALALAATLGLVGRVRGGSAEGSTGEPSGTEEEDEKEPPSELLSNEERVLATLEENGGRMKQQELADRLDWGAPKTSRVVGSLREDEEVEVFRLGRENVVTLPEEELI